MADANFAYADTGAIARVTVELPEALQADKDYCVFYGIESFPEYIWGCTYVRAAAGAASFSAELPLEDSELPYVFGYADASADGRWYGLDVAGRLYASETGVTGDPAKAASFGPADIGQVTIASSGWLSISGALRRGEFMPGEKAAAYAVAEFEDGERFLDRVVFGAEESERQYRILIPADMAGKPFTLRTAPAVGGRFMAVVEDAMADFGSFLAAAELDGGILTLDASSDGLTAYSGTIALPGGIKAPDGGTVFALETPGEDSLVTIPAGQNATAFAFRAVPAEWTLRVRLITTMDGVFPREDLWIDRTTDLAIAFEKGAFLSGTALFPEAAAGAVRATVYAQGDDWDTEQTLALAPGECSAAYSLPVKAGRDLRLSAWIDGDESGTFPSAAYRSMGEGWRQGSLAALRTDEDRSGLDFDFSRPLRISGQLADEGGRPVGIGPEATAATLDFFQGGSSASWMRAEALVQPDGSWSADLPEGLYGEYAVRVTLSGFLGRVVPGSYYYAEGGVCQRLKASDEQALLGGDALGLALRVSVSDAVLYPGVQTSSVLRSLKRTKTLQAAAQIAPDPSMGVVLGVAALYDGDGRFLGLATDASSAGEEVFFGFSFEDVPQSAASLQVMFTGEDLSPLRGVAGAD